jgi:hypothetical protein
MCDEKKVIAILREAVARKIWLRPLGRILITYPLGEPVEENFDGRIIERRGDLIRALMEVRHLAKQVLHGEFADCDGHTWAVVHRELSLNKFDPRCCRALARLAEADTETKLNKEREN